VVLTANRNVDLLIQQAIKYLPEHVVIADESKYSELRNSLSNYPVKIHSGTKSIAEIVELDSINIVLAAMVGYAGLLPTMNAIKSGKDIALANKETLVVAGELITRLIKEHNVNIYPVDSEHSAIFQCLTGENGNKIEKIYLTASGGPFKDTNLEELQNVTKEEALLHPNWNMGEKISIDSASLMNKGLEVIEAKWLFDLNPQQINVIIHPQSIIHSIVQFEDGSMKAQMGLPDMKMPIQYALSYPNRLKSNFQRFNFFDYPNLTFEAPNTKKFRNLALSFEALKKGGNMPCILNAANEVAVEAFLNGSIGFLKIPIFIEKAMNTIDHINEPSFDDYVKTNNETRILTNKLIYNSICKD